MVFNYDASDPLAVVTAPPPNEMPQEKAAREEREAEAQRISDQIDEELRAHRAVLKKEEQMVKILLLGQSESGKSTTLKNFRMRFAWDKWVQERASWRTVIQLNLVRSVNTILEALQQELSEEEVTEGQFTNKHHLLSMRLGPLRGVETDLKRLLGAKPEEVQATPSEALPTGSARTSSEFFVRSRNFRNFLQASRSTDGQRQSIRQEGVSSHDITEVIVGCKDDVKSLWRDNAIQEMVERRKIRLEDSASFFLNASDRLASRNYEPTDDDIVRARLRTLDIQEHELNVEEGMVVHLDGKPRVWKIYDVGGSRTQRQAWLPYFDQVNAVIFLAPISCFDERLQEDPRVNRLEDSFILWKAICSSKLLSRTTLVIFLNKVDLLEKKIASGVMVNRYLPSYADRRNEKDAVVSYLRSKFKDTVKHHSPEPRVCHIHVTSVINTQMTAKTLLSVRDGILREHLKKANLV
ncbi:guanine nucleotide binding protein, alpha subunit [Phlebopus sp. FC_14]|nr:guanine nucleotide binding protein, alpha subunit [Phlebopus sp. FC_14]